MDNNLNQLLTPFVDALQSNIPNAKNEVQNFLQNLDIDNLVQKEVMPLLLEYIMQQPSPNAPGPLPTNNNSSSIGLHTVIDAHRCIEIDPFCIKYTNFVILFTLIVFKIINYVISQNQQIITNNQIIQEFKKLKLIGKHKDGFTIHSTKFNQADRLLAQFEYTKIRSVEYNILCKKIDNSNWNFIDLTFVSIVVNVVSNIVLPNFLRQLISNMEASAQSSYLNTYPNFIKNPS